MPPTLADRLTDILRSIEIIETMLVAKTREDFVSDIPLRLAVERSLEIICEASRRLPDKIKAAEPEIGWQRMVDFGNLLRHAYHRIDPQIVFDAAVLELPRLKALAQRKIQESEE